MRQFTRTYECEDYIEVWTYDLDKFSNGPIEVNTEYKKGAEKEIEKRAKEAKQIKKTARQMKKINNR
jgi:hypothetical protein